MYVDSHLTQIIHNSKTPKYSEISQLKKCAYAFGNQYFPNPDLLIKKQCNLFADQMVV